MVAAALKAGITIAALTRALSESTIFEVSFIQQLVPDTTIAADLRNRMDMNGPTSIFRNLGVFVN